MERTKYWYAKDQLTTKETTRQVPNLPKKNAWNNNTSYSVT